MFIEKVLASEQIANTTVTPIDESTYIQTMLCPNNPDLIIMVSTYNRYVTDIDSPETDLPQKICARDCEFEIISDVLMQKCEICGSID